jgi:hypothetical protein
MSKTPSQSSERNRVVVAVVALLLAIIATLVARWQIAKYRAANIAASAQRGSSVASPQLSNSNQSPDASVKRRSTYALPASASQATVHLNAIENYETRSTADLAALPPPGEPMNAERFVLLTKLANEGNARAACSLGKEAEKCVFFPKMIGKEMALREAQLNDLVRAGSADQGLAEQVSAARTYLRQIRASCEGFDMTKAQPAWRTMLESALMGYEPAMIQFVMQPLFDPTDWSVNVDAYAAQLAYYGPLLDTVAQRGHDFFTMVASKEYGGYPMTLNLFGVSFRMSDVQPDPVRALAFAYASVELQQRRYPQGTTLPVTYEDKHFARQLSLRRENVAKLESEYSPDHKTWARALADQMSANWSLEVNTPPKPLPHRTDEQVLAQFDAVCRE